MQKYKKNIYQQEKFKIARFIFFFRPLFLLFFRALSRWLLVGKWCVARILFSASFFLASYNC